MTTINNVIDLIRILYEQPEWAAQVRAAIMGNRFLELPDRVDAMNQAIEDLARTGREIAEAADRRQARLESRLDRIEETLEEHGKQLEEHGKQLEEHGKQLEEHGRMLAEHGEKLEEHTGMLAEIREEVTRHGGQLAHLMGHNFEALAAEPARRKLRDALALSTLAVFSQSGKPSAERLENLAREARIAGAISDDGQADLGLADLVFEGMNGAEPVFVVAEISITVGVEDVVRSARRAALLGQATGARAIAAVVGAGLEADAAGEADRNAVTFSQVSEAEAQDYQ